MVDRSAHWLVMVLVTGLFAVFCTSAAWAGVIEGSVEETDGARVKVRFAAAEMPETGDFVDLGLEDSDGRTTLLGTWKVTEVADGFVWAEALDEAAEPTPQARAFIYAGSADACAEKGPVWHPQSALRDRPLVTPRQALRVRPRSGVKSLRPSGPPTTG